MRRDLIVHLLRTLAPITVGLSPMVERGSYCADLSLTALVSCLRGSPNKSPGYGSLGKACHPESFDCHSRPFACHSEPFGPCHPEHIRSAQCKLREGSDPAQGRLREESQDKLCEGS